MKTTENKITEKVNMWEELAKVKKLEEPTNTLQEILESIEFTKSKNTSNNKYTKLIFLYYKNNDLEIIYEILYKGGNMYLNKFFPNDALNEGRITSFEIKNGICQVTTPIENLSFGDLFKLDESNSLWGSKDHPNFALLKAFTINNKNI